MERGEFYRLEQPTDDPRKFRIFLIVSRQEFVDAPFSSAIAIPVYTSGNGLLTEVHVGPEVGLRYVSVLRCDQITSVRKDRLTRFLGRLPDDRWPDLERAMATALSIRGASIDL